MSDVKSFVTDREARQRGWVVDENNSLVLRYARVAHVEPKDAVRAITKMRADDRCLSIALGMPAPAPSAA
ncbi:MAG: hypothetical protein GC137_00100 [Alphaproteobacteria bacterium]|nr:hypothetical protein [Alphaproteobacteria bacterium]